MAAAAGDSVPSPTPGPARRRRDPNPSLVAIAEAYKIPPGWTATATAAFSSATKWSGASYGEQRHLGDRRARRAAEPGSTAADRPSGSARWACGCCCSAPAACRSTPDAPGLHARALIVLEQRIRPDARETLEYFASQNGLHQGDVRRQSGLGRRGRGLTRPPIGETIDARELPDDPDELADTLEEYTTFGRVRPEQKRTMVNALQAHGHTVAMTGDGVNDVLALKDADIGVAMGSGSSASRAVGDIVLLDNKFATLPHVVGEGRRVIGNIERVSNLFLTKTIYSVLLASWWVGRPGAKLFGSDPLLFPFQPIHVTMRPGSPLACRRSSSRWRPTANGRTPTSCGG